MDILTPLKDSITTAPISVIIWIHDDVTQQDRDRVLPMVEDALTKWSTIPGCRLRFEVTKIYSGIDLTPWPPFRQPHQLLIPICYTTTRSASGNPPDFGGGGVNQGNPGWISGVPADIITGNLSYNESIIHELGHALGFWHSSLGTPIINTKWPIMHWAGGTDNNGNLTLDDQVLAITAYPDIAVAGVPVNGGQILGFVAAPKRLKGTCVTESGTPINGVHVVVKNSAGIPVTSRVTGPRPTATMGQNDGEYEFKGLPPGNYTLEFHDGNTVGKNHGKLTAPIAALNPTDFLGMVRTSGFQADNFPLSSVNVKVPDKGDVIVPNTTIKIAPMSIKGHFAGTSIVMSNGFLQDSFSPIVNNTLPSARVGQPYHVWLPVSGGVRPIGLELLSLPSGITGKIETDPRPHTNAVYGKSYVHLQGTLTATGMKTVSFRLKDLHNKTAEFNYSFKVL